MSHFAEFFDGSDHRTRRNDELLGAVPPLAGLPIDLEKNRDEDPKPGRRQLIHKRMLEQPSMEKDVTARKVPLRGADHATRGLTDCGLRASQRL